MDPYYGWPKWYIEKLYKKFHFKHIKYLEADYIYDKNPTEENRQHRDKCGKIFSDWYDKYYKHQIRALDRLYILEKYGNKMQFLI